MILLFKLQFTLWKVQLEDKCSYGFIRERKRGKQLPQIKQISWTPFLYTLTFSARMLSADDTAKCFKLFQKMFKFSCHIWNQHEKCIQMSTNKPSIGSVIHEIALDFEKIWRNFNFFCSQKTGARVESINSYKQKTPEVENRMENNDENQQLS